MGRREKSTTWKNRLPHFVPEGFDTDSEYTSLFKSLEKYGLGKECILTYGEKQLRILLPHVEYERCLVWFSWPKPEMHTLYLADVINFLIREKATNIRVS